MTNDLDESFQTWKKDPKPEHLNTVVGHLQPTIDKAVGAFAPNTSPIVRDRARLLAAKAVQSYEPTRGANLHTHVYRQLQALQRMAPQIHDPMPMPERMRRDRGNILKSINEVQDTLGREPSDEEIAELGKLPLKRVIKVRGMLRAGLPQSVIEQAGDEDEDANDLVAHQTTAQDDWLEAVYHDLGDIDRVILQYRSGFRGAPKVSNQEIAKKLRMSPQAVSQRASRIQARLDAFDAN